LCTEGDDLVVRNLPDGGAELTCPRSSSHPDGGPYVWTVRGGGMKAVADQIGQSIAKAGGSAFASNRLDLEVVRVSTLADVRDRLTTGRASFEDWLDCVDVANEARDWDLLEASAKRAIDAAASRPLASPRLSEAARVVARASLAGSSDLAQLEAALRRAQGIVEHYIRRPGISQALRAKLEEELASVSEMLLHVADGSSASLARLSRMLRERDRSDLAVICTSHGLSKAPDEPALLTARGAALLDQGEHLLGYQDLARAHRLRPSVFALRGLSRSCRLRNQLPDAVDYARQAAHMEPSAFSAKLLSVAAIAAGDDAALQEAEALSAQFPGSIRGNVEPQRLAQLLAARQFVRDQQYEAALVVLDALLRAAPWKEAEDLRGQALWRLSVQRQAGATS
jgi:hypothetical protein